MTTNFFNQSVRRAVWIPALMFGLFFSVSSFADSPVSVDKPDSHSVEVKGKVSLYRVQVEGMNMGAATDKVNAELFVSLDSNPDMVYALDLTSKSPASNKVIADTLRDAYINQLPITLYHQIDFKKKNNFKILMVQVHR